MEVKNTPAWPDAELSWQEIIEAQIAANYRDAEAAHNSLQPHAAREMRAAAAGMKSVLKSALTEITAAVEAEREALLPALVTAEAALSDIGDAEREEGDDLAWCERRAAEALPQVRAAIRARGTTDAPTQQDDTFPSQARDLLEEAVYRLWGQFYDRSPPGDPKDTLRQIIRLHRADVIGRKVFPTTDALAQQIAEAEKRGAERMRAEMVQNVRAYVDEYSFRCDGGAGYDPSENERAMLEDAILGFLDHGEDAALPSQEPQG